MSDQRVEVVCTWNAYNHNTVKKVVHGISHMVEQHDPDLISLQEMSPFVKPTRRVAKTLGLATHVMAKKEKRGMVREEAQSTILLRNKQIPLWNKGFIKIKGKWRGPKLGLMRPGRVFPTLAVGEPKTRVTAIHGTTGRRRFRKNELTWEEFLRKLDKRVTRWKTKGLRIIIIGDTNDPWTNRDPDSLRKFCKKHDLRLVHDEAKLDYALVWGFKGADYQSYKKMGSDTHRYGVLTLSY